jgi:TIR domain
MDKIQPGQRWKEMITDAIFNSSAVLVLATPNPERSSDFSREISTALSVSRTNVPGVSPVIPVLIDADSSSLPKELRDIQAVDFTSSEDRRRLWYALESLASTS